MYQLRMVFLSNLSLLSSVATLPPGFFQSFFMTIVSELGDKTFFIAAVMAINNSRLNVFIGALTAMMGMTALSALLGAVAESVVCFVSLL